MDSLIVGKICGLLLAVALLHGVDASRIPLHSEYVQDSSPTLTIKVHTNNQATSSTQVYKSRKSRRRDTASATDIFSPSKALSENPSQQPTYLLKDQYAIFAFDMSIAQSLEGTQSVVFLEGIKLYVQRLSKRLFHHGSIKNIQASILSQQAYLPDPSQDEIERVNVAVKITVAYMGHDDTFDMFSTFKAYMLPNQELRDIWSEIVSEMPEQAAEQSNQFLSLVSQDDAAATNNSKKEDFKVLEIIIVTILLIGVAASAGTHSVLRSAARSREKGDNLDDHNAIDRMIDRTREITSEEEEESSRDESFRRETKSERSTSFSVAESQGCRSMLSGDNEAFSVAESLSHHSILSREVEEMIPDHPPSPIIAIAASDSTDELSPSPVIAIATRKAAIHMETRQTERGCDSGSKSISLLLGDRFEPHPIPQIASDSTDEETGVTF